MDVVLQPDFGMVVIHSRRFIGEEPLEGSGRFGYCGLPYHALQGERAHAQAAAGKPLQKRLWHRNWSRPRSSPRRRTFVACVGMKAFRKSWRQRCAAAIRAILRGKPRGNTGSSSFPTSRASPMVSERAELPRNRLSARTPLAFGGTAGGQVEGAEGGVDVGLRQVLTGHPVQLTRMRTAAVEHPDVSVGRVESILQAGLPGRG